MQAGRVALDTEFQWERTFYPIPATVQLGISDSECYLIDALALPQLPGLGRLLADSGTEKILHDAQQDLAILSRCSGAAPHNIFDTRRAAGFAAMDSTLSLANLMKILLDIDLPKTETRSNWLQRPLSDLQTEYALNDVRYLPRMRDLLIEKISRLGNLERLREEMEMYNNPELYSDPTAETLLARVKGGRMNGTERAVLLELLRWREKQAIDRNRPRNFIMKNRDLIAVARARPHDSRELQQIRDIPAFIAKRLSGPVLAAVKKGEQGPPQAALERGERISEQTKSKIADYIQTVHSRAKDAGIDPALIGSKKTLTEIFLLKQKESSGGDLFESAPALPVAGWRTDFV